MCFPPTCASTLRTLLSVPTFRAPWLLACFHVMACGIWRRHGTKILLTEEFDEGLMVMRRLLGWEMVDMTYVSMYKTVDGAHRFDGKLLVSAPHFEDLPEHVRKNQAGSVFFCHAPVERSTQEPRVVAIARLEFLLVRHVALSPGSERTPVDRATRFLDFNFPKKEKI